MNYAPGSTVIKIYKCLPYEYSCPASSVPMKTVCDVGFTGPLCQTCSKYYAKYGGANCLPCSSDSINYFLLFIQYFFYLVLLLIYLRFFSSLINIFEVIYFRFSYKSSKKLKSKQFAAKKIFFSAYIKIFLNYTQIISIISCLNLDWGSIMVNQFSVFNSTSGNMHQVISYECLIEGNFKFPLSWYLLRLDPESVFFFKIGSVVFLPFIWAGALIIFWLAMFIITRISLGEAIKNYIQTWIICFTFFLSPILNTIADFLHCIRINDGEYYNVLDLNLSCSTNKKYILWRNFFIIPSFICYAMLIPLCTFIYMFRNRKKLFEYGYLSRISFLLKGYQREAFYW